MSQKENIFRNFLEDPLLYEKKYLTKEEMEDLKLYEVSKTKIIEVIRIAVTKYDSEFCENLVKREINNSFRR